MRSLTAIAAIMLAGSCAPGSDPSATAAYADAISGCGDTIRCGAERIRLLAIDAPELAGHCRPGRRCAPGDGAASVTSLAQALAGRLTIERAGEDRYGRTLALVAGDSGDLSCWQLSRGQAIYKPAWDDGGRVAHACPLLTD